MLALVAGINLLLTLLALVDRLSPLSGIILLVLSVCGIGVLITINMKYADKTEIRCFYRRVLPVAPVLEGPCLDWVLVTRKKPRLLTDLRSFQFVEDTLLVR